MAEKFVDQLFAGLRIDLEVFSSVIDGIFWQLDVDMERAVDRIGFLSKLLDVSDLAFE